MSGKREKHKKKRRKVGQFLGVFLLIFIALVMVSETVLAVVNIFVWNEANIDDFLTPIAVMPAIALILTGIIIYINNSNRRYAALFAEALDRVSHGEFGYQIEVPKKSGRFGTLFENFNKMSLELKSIQSLKDEFIHDFSHEFKTPISSINGFANLLLEGGVSEQEQRQYLKIIADESYRLSRLSENTLLINRLENQQFVGETETFRPDLQIKECIILLESEWSVKNLTFATEFLPTELNGNASLMQQVWLNLLTNAIKFTPAGGEITVKMSLVHEGLQVAVTDTGIGMSAEVASHVFDKYYKGDSSHGTVGNGLGLAIVRRAVNLAGGTVSVASREGEGSTFTVTLPIQG